MSYPARAEGLVNMITAFFPVLLGCSTRAQPLWVLFSLLYLISNSTDPQLLSQRPEGSPCWVLGFSTASCHQLVWSPTNWLPVSPSYIIVQGATFCGRHNRTHSTIHAQGNDILIARCTCYLRRCNFLFWQPGRIVGQYTTSVCFYLSIYLSI